MGTKKWLAAALCWPWETIDKIGQSRAFRSSYFFMAFVPIAAKALQGVEDPVEVTLWGHTYELAITLPFSWGFLFAAAVLASAGNLIYSVRCPKIINSYRSHTEFEESGRDCSYLASLLPYECLRGYEKIHIGVTTPLQKLRHGQSAKVLVEKYGAQIAKYDAVREYFNIGEEAPANAKIDAFYLVRDSANKALPASRFAATAFYFLAFLCLGWIVFENVRYVLDHYFPAFVELRQNLWLAAFGRGEG